jgi:hypothetical protein
MQTAAQDTWVLQDQRPREEKPEARGGENEASASWWESPPFRDSSSPALSSLASSGPNSSAPGSPNPDSARSGSPDFAGVLSAFSIFASDAGERIQGFDRASGADEEPSEAEVALLSYERALRARAGYAPAEGQTPVTGLKTITEADGSPSENSAQVSAEEEQNRKTASVTIRMSQAECAQLKTRAAEAGLTISAYLRSCTFEAEALRAQVKQALVELRAASSDENPPAQPQETQWPRRWWHLMPPLKGRGMQA